MLDLRYRSILAMAIPLMASTFVQSVVMITDSAFLSRYSTIAFDASGNGGLIFVTMFITLAGLNDGSQILMARRIGEQNENLLSRIFGTTLFINLLIALALFSISIFVLPGFINYYSSHSEIAAGQIDFLNIRSYGLFFAMISLAINAYFMATGRTTIVFISALVTAISNIGLDYILIFGNSGFPELGLEGAAYASTISDGISMVFLFVMLNFNSKYKKHQLFSELKYNYISFKNVLKIGSPIMATGLIGLSTWTVFFIWIEQMGEFELTVSQTIRSIYFVAFIPLMGFAATTKTYVSQYLGKKNYASIPIIQRKIQILTLIFLAIFFHGPFLYPEIMISVINPNPDYLDESVRILKLVAASIFIYSVFNVYTQTINGSGNTRVTFIIEVISVFFYLCFAYLFIKIFNWEIYKIWTVEFIYFITLGVCSIVYLKYFNWQKKTI